MFKTFIRTWWKPNKEWPDGLEPHPGKKRTVGRNLTEEQARRMCEQYNTTHKPGKLSRKMGYEEQ